MTLSLRNIDYLQALGSGVVHGIRCAAGLLGEVADAQTAIIDQVTVSLVHTAAVILLGGICYFTKTSHSKTGLRSLKTQ